MTGHLPMPRHSHGFTYIGLLIFVAVLGVIAAATISAGALMQRRAAETELLIIGKEFRAAFKSYAEASGGARPYPPTLSALTKDERTPQPRRHLRKIYFDPLTGKDDWGIVEAPGGGVMGVYSPSTETPIKIAEFEVDFAGFTGKKKYSDWVFTYNTGLPPAGTVSMGEATSAEPSATAKSDSSTTPSGAFSGGAGRNFGTTTPANSDASATKWGAAK